ncbi:Mur ligase family protein [Microbacterium sp. NIBRBAC000506063]|uniref:Mur ligase family protein n=1 Tax=Microbacterium sp. NIBRBAC000506063 TaxID=2734618 RepID=UPI001BB4910F|nr:Mur ligase family protein [Microbacterium sp. NIBRBAC000506063]QTV80574.1 hypothetical protein KAE78_06885 [Microbacterium sp. NIBRBAC000506063]
MTRILGTSLSASTSPGYVPDEPTTGIISRRGDLIPGCIAVLGHYRGATADADQITIEDAVAAGALMVISEAPHEALPCVVVQDAWAARSTLMQEIRGRYSPLTLAVTGTVGKTTTKDLLGSVFDRHCRTLHVEGNNNTSLTVSMVLQKLTDKDDAYIQEVHEGSPGSARRISQLIQPDIAIITEVGEGHLNQLGSISNVVDEVTQVIAGLSPDGVVIVNNDNQHLRAWTPPVRSIRYGLNDDANDYSAHSIRTTPDGIDFEVHYPGGSIDASLGFGGMHNVSNALAAFAAAHQAGVPVHKIVAGLSRYRVSKTRQNVVEVGGYSLLIDTYNSNVLSLVSALETLCELPVQPGGRRVVVMGTWANRATRSVRITSSWERRSLNCRSICSSAQVRELPTQREWQWSMV